jgi:hypothetical protein
VLFALLDRLVNRATAADVPRTDEAIGGSRGTFPIDARGARGLQIGIGNVQHNHFS